MTKLYKELNDKYWKTKNEILVLRNERDCMNEKIRTLEHELEMLNELLSSNGKHVYEHFEENDEDSTTDKQK